MKLIPTRVVGERNLATCKRSSIEFPSNLPDNVWETGRLSDQRSGNNLADKRSRMSVDIRSSPFKISEERLETNHDFKAETPVRGKQKGGIT